MRVLLVSLYELGHQPLHVASPAAALIEAGHEVRCVDVSVEPWDLERVRWADAVALSVPMHTAMRLALRAAASIRAECPDTPVCLYGLYAPVSRDLTVGALADRVIAGEYEPALVAWVDALAAGAPAHHGAEEPMIQLGRGGFRRPARRLLPPLEEYAHLALDGEERLVGYVEASHGCVHRCRHCPVPTVYDGRIRIVELETVIEDVAQLVSAGARHITFGDPDFLNGRRHSLAVAAAVHERFPDLTFDCTIKVEHVLEHADVWPALREAGCLFVVCALESVNEGILERLDKGHTVEEARAAIALLREHGIEVRPSWMPFTPWTTLEDLVELMDFVVEEDLIANVDPVQYAIRLLLPEGSLLLEHPDLQPHLGPYDAEGLGYTWTAADPRVDRLQARLSALVAEAGDAPTATTFSRVRRAVLEAAGRPGIDEREAIPIGSVEGRPRLTEPWFC